MLRLELARWIVELDVQPAPLAERLAWQYAPFACDSGRSADLRCVLAFEPGDEPGASILRTPLHKQGEQYLLDGPRFYGMIAPTRGQGTLRMRSDEPAREAEYFLRVAVALLAWSQGGLLAHSAAVVVGGRAVLFTGQSGSGKSTVVTLSRARGHSVALGDDLVLLRRASDGWRAYGTPFWNAQAVSREGQTANGRIHAIYKLVQDREVFVEPLSGASAAAELLANCPVINSVPALLPALLARCGEITKAVSLRRLHFRRDDAFWDVISC